VTDFAAPAPDLTPDAFRAAVRDWLAAHFPPTLRGMLPPTAGVELDGPAGDHARWKQAVVDIGWGAPGWPAAYGGGGLSEAQVAVLDEELAAARAFNPVVGLGKMMLGPTLLEFGSEDQKRRHLPPIASGELTWCQGFSEPGAGSDLASLRTRCDDLGDHWLVNGQKIWTSYANVSDWCFCLVRTSTERKQGGISFLLIDMKSPGVEARPITLINGGTHFCETFFTDVKVPKDNLVGEIDAGWTIAKRLLQFERNGLSALRGSDPSQVDLAELAHRYCGADDMGRIADPDLRMRLADHMMDDHAYRLTLARRSREGEDGGRPTTPVSVMKNVGATIGMARSELATEILGSAGLGWSGQEYSDEEHEIVRLWLFSKCYSIYGGSHEVQNNITALRELGLPKG
jgi:acyl-CoA dehydrogenase